MMPTQDSQGRESTLSLAEDIPAEVGTIEDESLKRNSNGLESMGAGTDKDILCPVCFQTMKDPFLTACGHSFCYTCISTHLNKRSNCPRCSVYLNTDMMYPNLLLDKVLRKLSTLESLSRASPGEYLQLSLQHGAELSIKEIDSLLVLLSEKKIKAEQKEDEINMEFSFEFLHELQNRKEKELSELHDDLRGLKEHIASLRKERMDLSKLKECYLLKFSGHWEGKTLAVDDSTVDNSYGVSQNDMESSLSMPPRINARVKRITHSVAKSKKQILLNEYEVLQDCYIRKCRRYQQPQGSDSEQDASDSRHLTGLNGFRSFLSGFTRYRQLRVLAEMHHEHPSHSSNIISSIDFDRDDEFFTTAGVSGRLKVYDYSMVVNKSDGIWKPLVELMAQSKLSCVSWDNQSKNVIASSDYDGIIKMWDVSSGQRVAEYEEHVKRAWSVDFSQGAPSMLVSGSDDGMVKIWCREQKASVLTVDIKANICSVKYNPSSSNLVAAGSADHCIYYYDLRHTMSPVHVFRGHEKAVSYVKFMSPNEMVSASTDGTLRIWDLQSRSILETLRGHTNEKNFVGLAVSNEYAACGSETNEVFLYHKGVPKPAICHRYPVVASDDTPFISAVSWKRKDSIMLAANSQGTIRALALA